MISIDIKGLYYSLPHKQLLSCIEDAVDTFGAVNFQNQVGLSVSDFLRVLECYLKSSYVSWQQNTYVQKQGVCIGSCVAPILSELFLAQYDRIVNDKIPETAIVEKIFRYVDDYLVILRCSDNTFNSAVSHVLSLFEQCVPLKVTHETPVDQSIRFL